jgi:hypothetical protein
MKILAASAIGVSEPESESDFKIPTVVTMVRVYNIVTTPTDVIMPNGIVFWGFLTSSETLATFNRPPKEMKIKPAVMKMGLNPWGARGLKYEGFNFGIPTMIYNPIKISKPITRETWSLAASFTPSIFMNIKQKQSRTEDIVTFIPVTKKIISDIPNIAKALFRDSANHPNRPDIVPTRGPRLRLIK